MKNIFKITFLASVLTVLSGCETTELELLDSPNVVGVDLADPNFVLNDIQLTFATGVASGFSGTSMALTRMINQFGTYSGLVDENTISAEWSNSYNMFGSIDLLNQINENEASTGGIPYHLGVGQILEAYGYMLLVDYAGNVPFSQANMPEEFPNPVLDNGKDIYDAQLELLDVAIANLSQTSAKIPNDLFYGSFSADNWIALANTLKIRAFTNIRLTDPARATAGINSVLTQNFIDTTVEDFQFGYSSTIVPESRHPFFQGNYLAAGAATYMSNNYYDYLNAGDSAPPFVETGIADPRLRYYIYRQRNQAPSGSNLPCTGNPTYFYCYVGNLYWGRDHADDEGLPNDGTRRSTYGIYPGGGAFDRDQFQAAREVSQSLGGAGILPIYLSSFTHFALAENALTLGTGGGTPVALLEQGIRLSMNKVRNFVPGTIDTGTFAMTAADINNYVARIIAEYTAAADNNARLAIIEREYFLAAFGNGIEPYNTYRRTGLPELQDPIIPAGPFPRAWRYPTEEVVNNPNITQQPLTTQVFWDNNPSGFID